jgi:hypothetical protein
MEEYCWAIIQVAEASVLNPIKFPMCCSSDVNWAALYNWYEGCPESIRPFWISREPVAWPWCNLAASQRRPYCESVNSHFLVGLVSRQLDAVEWACVLCGFRNHSEQTSTSTSSQQCALPFYSFRAGIFLNKKSHHPSPSAQLQPGLGSLQLLAFPKAKIAVEK